MCPPGYSVTATGQKTKMRDGNTPDSQSAAELFINSVPSMLIGIDAGGCINRWNRAAAQTFGLEPAEVLGKPLSNCGIRWLNSDIEATIGDLLRSPRRFVWDGMRFEKDGEPHLLGMTVNCIEVPDSKRGNLLIVGSDISSRNRTEDELRAKTAFFEAQIQANIDGIMVVDENGNILLHNERFGQIFEVPPELFETADDNPILKHVARKVQDSSSFVERVNYLYSHRQEKSRDEIKLRDGRVLDRYSSPVFGTDGHYYGRIWTFRDITERKQAEDALRQLSVAVEQSPVAVVITDLQGNITYVNRRFTECTGYRDEEVIGQNPRLLKSGHTSPEQYRQLWQTITRGEEWRGELLNKKKNGDLYWESAVISPIRGSAGEISHFLAVKEDVTERRQAEKDLRLMKFALENAADSVLWADRQARILYANETACRVLGRSRQELTSLSIPDVDPLFPREKWQEFWKELKTHRSITFETQPKNKDGRVVAIEVMATYLEFDGQEYLLSFARDISERKRAEKDLRLTRFSLENAADIVLWVDQQAHILYANETACRVMGRSRQELTALSIPDIDPLFPKERWQGFWNEVKTRHSLTFESQATHRDGRVFQLEVTATYLEFDGQEFLLSFARDISERRMIQAQLQQAQKMESIGQLAAGIAHEINTPIQFVGDNLRFIKDSWSGLESLISLCESLPGNAIAGDHLQRLRRILEESDSAYLRAEIPRALEQSLDGISRVAKIVRAMKEFSHPGSEEKQPADINQAILTTLTVSRNEWKYVAEVETVLQPDMQMVPCHIGELNQVLLNLLINSAHAIAEVVGDGPKKGKITIRTAQEARFTTISVQDTGAGIPPEIQPRIFDPFFTTKAVGRGTGQGLSLAYNSIVKKHGGKIWFDSEVGRGTTFFIQLPPAGEAGYGVETHSVRR